MAMINATERQNQGRGRGGGVAPSFGRGSSKMCTYCGKTGHTVDVCFWKHGFPPGSRPRELLSAHNVVGEEEHNNSNSDDLRRGQ